MSLFTAHGPLHLFRFALEQTSLRAQEVAVLCVWQLFARSSLQLSKRKKADQILPGYQTFKSTKNVTSTIFSVTYVLTQKCYRCPDRT
jgi:hypothetical protein